MKILLNMCLVLATVLSLIGAWFIEQKTRQISSWNQVYEALNIDRMTKKRDTANDIRVLESDVAQSRARLKEYARFEFFERHALYSSSGAKQSIGLDECIQCVRLKVPSSTTQRGIH